MLARLARGLTVLTPYVQKQRHTINVHLQFVRLLSQTPTLNVAKPKEDDVDLVFDLGGSNGKADKIKKPENGKADKIKKSENSKSEVSAKSKENKPMGKNRNKVTKDQKKDVPKSKKDRSFEQLKYHDLGINLTYVKLPFEHPGLQNLMLMLKSRKYRSQKNLLLVEGRRLTLEAIEAGLKMKYLFFSHLKQIEAIRDQIEPAFVKDTEILRVPHNDLSYWSTLTTCPGLITVFEKPNDMDTIWENVARNKLIKMKQKQTADQTSARNESDEINAESEEIYNQFEPMPITVICDQVREPNNLGSIIRTCASVPCSRIILLKGCADPWDIKALRGGCGAQFRIELVGPVEWEELPQLLPRTDELSVFIADNQSQIDGLKLPFDESDQNRKQRTVRFLKPKVYSDIPFFNCKHIALIIGGETEGVSSHAFDFMKFVTKHTKATSAQAKADTPQTVENELEESPPDNAVLEIPLGNGVESLNASVATAILLFEMRKQLTK